MTRYHRQTLLPQIGPQGQERLRAARMLLVGCGALGSVLADQLVRAGVGLLRLVDRDVVELTNLQRQVLFDEEDARQGLPKAVAAAERLRRVNSEVQIEAVVADAHAGNIEALAGLEADRRRCDVILDGTDNAETRYLINDVAVKHGVPWVYGACVGTEGRVMAIRPPNTACLRCVFPEPPGPGELPTCDTTGVLGAAAAAVAAVQTALAMKLLTGRADERSQNLLTLDLWTGRFRTIDLAHAKLSHCRTCGERDFEFLNRPAGQSVSLCGRDAVQVRPLVSAREFSLDRLAARLRSVGDVEQSRYLVRCRIGRNGAAEGVRLTVFGDGRAVIQGTTNIDEARSIYAKMVGC